MAIGQTLDMTDSTLKLLSENGGKAVGSNETIANSIVDVDVLSDVTTDGNLKATDSKITVNSSAGMMDVTGATEMTNTTATLTLYNGMAIGQTLDMTDSTLKLLSENGGKAVGSNETIANSIVDVDVLSDVTTDGNLNVADTKMTVKSSAGKMDVTGLANIAASEATLTIYNNTNIGKTFDLTDSTLTLTSANGGMAVGEDETITNSTATLRVKTDVTTGGNLTMTDSLLDVESTEGTMEVTGKTLLTGPSDAKLVLGDSAIFLDDVLIDASRMVITAGGDYRTEGTVDVLGKRGEDGSVERSSLLKVDAGHDATIYDVTRNGKDVEGILNVRDAITDILARTGDASISHLNVNDAIVNVRANTGIYRGETVNMEASAVTLEGYAGVTIASDDNDAKAPDGEFEDNDPIVYVYNSMNDETVTVKEIFTGTEVTENRGLYITSDTGAMDSSNSGYNVYFNKATGDTVYEKDGSFFRFVFGAEKGDDSFGQVDRPDDLETYEDLGNYSLFAYNYASDPDYYDEGQRVYLEKLNKFYYLQPDGTVKLYGSLADKVKDDNGMASNVGNTKLYALRDVGMNNYYDGWYVDRSYMTVDAMGDVDFRDTVRMMESVADIISRNGALTVADYFIDEDGDGIGDRMETTEWDIRGSVANTEIFENIRIDHLSLQVSVMDMNVERDSITSKTWYMVGSKLSASAENAVQVINADDKYLTPALEAFWSNDDLYLIRADSVDEPVYEQLGLFVRSRNGDVIFITKDGDKGDSNTIDFYATASTIDIDVRDKIIIPEAMVNVDEATNNGVRNFTSPKGFDLNGNDPDTVTHKEIFKIVDGTYTAMTDDNFTQAERAYGSEINLKSTGIIDELHVAEDNRKPDSHISAANWTVEGATLKDGTLNAGLGQTEINMTAKGDISFLYNLNYLDAAKRQAASELALTEGSRMTLTSTNGAVDLLYDYDKADDAESTLAYIAGDYVGDNGLDLANIMPDVVIAGDTASGERSVLTVISDDDLKVAAIRSDFADVNLRTTTKDILFDRIDATQSNMRIESAASIEALHPEHSVLIRYNDKESRDDPNLDQPDNASLTLSAEESIGNEEHALLADIPEALTIKIEKVKDLYLDGWKRDETGTVPNDDPVTAVNEGYSTETGKAMSGDYLRYSNEAFYAIVAKDLGEGKLADWLMAHSDMFPLDPVPAEEAAAIPEGDELPAWAGMVSTQVVDLKAYIVAKAAEEGEEIPADMTLADMLALKGEKNVFEDLLADGLVTYVTKDASGQRVDGSLQDLIQYVADHDESYAAGLDDELLNSAILAGTRYAGDMTAMMNSAKADKASAIASMNASAAQRDAAEAALWVLQDQYAYESQKLAKLQAEYEELAQTPGTTRAMLRDKQKEIDEQTPVTEELTAQIQAKQAELDAAKAAMKRAEAAVKVSDDLMTQMLPEVSRANDSYAGYTDIGGAETGKAAWEGETETAMTATAADIVLAGQQTEAEAETSLETALSDLNSAMATLTRVGEYSETSLGRAGNMAAQMEDLAESLANEATIHLAAAEASYSEANAVYLDKVSNRAAARLAYEEVKEVLDEAQANYDDIAEKLETARARGNTSRIATLEAELAAAQTTLDEATAAADAKKAVLDAADAEVAEAKARMEERYTGILRTEAVITAAGNKLAEAKALHEALNNTTVDPDARRLNVQIGQANEGGTINITNEGDINVTVDSATEVPDYVALADSDVTVGRVESKRGDVTIVNNSGSILAADLEGEENVHGKAITLDARDSIGAEAASFIVEETGRHQTKIANAYLVNPEGESIFGGIVGIETAERFEDIAGAGSTEVPVIVVNSEGRRMSAVMSLKDLQDLYETDSDIITFGVVNTETDIPATGAARAEVRFDWIRTFDETEATELNAIARQGDIFLTEKTGNVGAGEIRAAGDAVLNVPTGSIATANNRSIAEIGGEMTVNAQGSVNLISEGDLTLNLNTDANHVEITTSDEKGAGDITVISTSTDPLTGSALSNGSVDIRNAGDIGTAGKAFTVDTDAANGGTAHIEGKNVNLEQKSGTMLVDEITADGDLNLKVGGSILDASEGNTRDILDKVQEAQQALTQAERDLNEADKAVYEMTWNEQPERVAEDVANAAAAVADAEAALEEATAEAQRTADELAAAKAYQTQVSRDPNATEDDRVKATYQLNQAQAAADEAAAALKTAKDNLAEAKREQAAIEKDPLARLMADKAAIEEARAAGTDEIKLSQMLDKAIDTYRKNTPYNGENSNQIFLRELELEQAQQHLAAAEAAIQAATTDKALAEAQAAKAAAEEEIRNAEAALAQAKEDTQAVRDALAEAQTVRDHAAEALEIAEDMLDAQVKAAEARRETEDAERAARNAATEEEKEAALKAAELASLKTDAAEYLLGAEENLYDAYKEYVALTDGGETDEAKLQAAADKLAVAQQAVEEARKTANLMNGTAEDQAIVKELMNRLDKAIAAEQALAENPDDENAALNAEMAREALAAAKQSAAAAAEQQEAREAAEAADKALTAAQTQLTNATNNLASAETNYQQALNTITELTEAKAGAKAINEARENAVAAYEALLAAQDAKAEAEQAKADAETAQAEAHETLAEAQVKAEQQQQLAKAAEEAADAKTAQDEAAAALAETQKPDTRADDLIDQLTEAEKALAEAQKLYDEAYQDYLISNTDIIPAQEGAEDTNDKLHAMDQATKALEAARQNLNQIVSDINAIVADSGLEEAEEKLAEADHNANEAERLMNDAQQTAEAQAEALVKAEQARDEAKKALEEAEANGATDDELLELSAAAAYTQLRYEQAVTADENARKAAEQATANRDAAAEALQNAKDAVAAKKQEISEASAQQHSDRIAAAQEVLAEAVRNAAEKNETLADAKESIGSIKADATGTGAVRSKDAKTGGAAIRVRGNAKITSGGDVAGQNGDSLTLAVDGTMQLSAAGSANLASEQTVKFDSIAAGQAVNMVVNGDILSSDKAPALSAGSVNMNAISTGDKVSRIGSMSGAPMNTRTSRLGLRADSADISNTGSVQLDDVIASAARITASGNISQTEGTEVDVSDLTLKAGGDIGSEAHPVVINTDVITAEGENVYLKNLSRMLKVRDIIGNTVSIDTNGSINTVADGIIKARDLIIRALGDIGSALHPLRVAVGGKISLSTQMGGIWYTRGGGWRWLIDPVTSIGVLGVFASDTELVVTTTAHYARIATEAEGCDCEDPMIYNADCTAKNYPDLVQALIDSDSSLANRMLWQMILDGRTVYDFVLGLFASVEEVANGTLYIRIDLHELDSEYDDSLEGQTVYVMAAVADRIVAVKTTVEDGVICISMEQLGMNEADFGYTQFAVVTEDTFLALEGEEAMTDAEITEFTGIPANLPEFPGK
ncbi:MAG: hypothetical protein IKR10_02355 [Firmicutes bacterium]|nr:hypothetical protein [Bacillota bacterium]